MRTTDIWSKVSLRAASVIEFRSTRSGVLQKQPYLEIDRRASTRWTHPSATPVTQKAGGGFSIIGEVSRWGIDDGVYTHTDAATHLTHFPRNIFPRIHYPLLLHWPSARDRAQLLDRQKENFMKIQWIPRYDKMPRKLLMSQEDLWWNRLVLFIEANFHSIGRVLLNNLWALKASLELRASYKFICKHCSYE